jgi:ABC-type sugar transport system ATPase subunit
MGAGRTESTRAIFGADPRASGTILLEGKDIPSRLRSPKAAVRLGIGFLTEAMETNLTESAPSVAATTLKLARRKRQARAILENCLGLVAVLILLTAVFSISTAHFFSVTTFISIANQIPTAVLIAVGMTFVLILCTLGVGRSQCGERI